MVSTWDSDKLINEIQKSINPDSEELEDLIRNNDLNTDVKIILVSEQYDPEVIITAEWLNGNYSVDITAFSLSLHKLGKQYFVNFKQRYPLKELADMYEERGQRRKSPRKKNVSWDEVIPKLQYKFAKRAIDLCLLEKEGEASRRRFGSIRSNYDGFNWISLSFRQKYINVYIKGMPENAQELIASKFSSKINILTWAKGYSFHVEKEKQFNELVTWLKLGRG